MFGVGFLVFRAGGTRAHVAPGDGGGARADGLPRQYLVLGLPMIEAYYGPQGLGLGILIDQMGTYLVLSTLGLLGRRAVRARAGISVRSVNKGGSSPSHRSSHSSSRCSSSRWKYPAWFDTLLRRLGTTLVPLARVSVGYQIQWSAVRGKVRELAVGLGFKLVGSGRPSWPSCSGGCSGRGEKRSRSRSSRPRWRRRSARRRRRWTMISTPRSSP